MTYMHAVGREPMKRTQDFVSAAWHGLVSTYSTRVHWILGTRLSQHHPPLFLAISGYDIAKIHRSALSQRLRMPRDPV